MYFKKAVQYSAYTADEKKDIAFTKRGHKNKKLNNATFDLEYGKK